LNDAVVKVVPASYGLYPYEQELLKREVRQLTGSPLNANGTVRTNNIGPLMRLAFAGSIRSSVGTYSTAQRLREMTTTGSKAKNSTYGPHGIHRYKGKFYPQLAKSLLNASNPVRGVVLDPFGGSGTVATEAILDGLGAISLDCNPVATACARAKSTLITSDVGMLRTFMQGLHTVALELKRRTRSDELDQFPSDLQSELESWFPDKVLRDLNELLMVIRKETDPELLNIAEVLVSDLIRDVSQQEPKDLRIRRRRVPITDAPVAEMFAARVGRLRDRMESLWASHEIVQSGAFGHARILLGDSSDHNFFESALSPNLIRTVVSSPPYGSALPYIDTDRLSLAAVFSYSPATRRMIESTMIGSREVSPSEKRTWEEALTATPDELSLPDLTLTFLQSYLQAVEKDDSAGFRKQQAPAVLTRYFVSMRRVFENFVPHLSDGADVWMVLGDSRSVVNGTNWTVPIVDSVAAIGKQVGLSLKESIPITVTREDLLNSRNAITTNRILHFRN
jgi:hypothetical protein